MNKQLLGLTLLLAVSNTVMADTIDEPVKTDIADVLQYGDNSASKDHATLKQLLNETLDGMRTDNAAPRVKAKSSADIAKLEALKGTWLVSYKVDGTQFTDKFVINGMDTSDSSTPLATGTIYINSSSTNTTLFCGYDASSFASLNSEYLCMAKNNGMYANYFFKISGDAITSGYFGIGVTTTAVIASVNKKDMPITGYREMPNPVISSNTQVDCILNWLEKALPSLLAPAAQSQFSAPYTYRYYSKSDVYLGFSSVDNHLYLLNASKKLSEHGTLQSWGAITSCK